MKRLFIGISFSTELKDYFKHAQLMVEKYCEVAKYTSYDNFHLTLKFLGMMEEASVNQLIEIINSIDVEKIILMLDHVGFLKRKIVTLFIWNASE